MLVRTIHFQPLARTKLSRRSAPREFLHAGHVVGSISVYSTALLWRTLTMCSSEVGEAVRRDGCRSRPSLLVLRTPSEQLARSTGPCAVGMAKERLEAVPARERSRERLVAYYHRPRWARHSQRELGFGRLELTPRWPSRRWSAAKVGHVDRESIEVLASCVATSTNCLDIESSEQLIL